MLSRRTSTLEGCTRVSSNGSIPNRPAEISALRSRSESSTRRAYRLLVVPPSVGEIHLPTPGVAAAGCRHVDVVVVAEPARLRPVGRVVDATPNRVLYPESTRVLEHVRDDLVAQRDALRALGIGDHHIQRQAEGGPGQRIRSDTTDFVNLGERHADSSGRQDRSYLQALLGGEPDGQETGSNVVPRRDRLAIAAPQTRRAMRQIRFRRDDFQVARRDVAHNRLGFRSNGAWTAISGHRAE